MSEARRERLMDIQKREQLKGMLISKFKVKYGDKPSLSKYIDNEVNRFMKNGRLTEDNLRQLDTKINKEAALRDKKAEILDDHKSQRSASQRSNRSHRSQKAAAADAEDDRKSVRSVASSRRSSQPARSLRSAGGASGKHRLNADALSQLSS